MTIDNNAGSLTENLISLIEACGGDRPESKGLQELYQALAVALAAFNPGGGAVDSVFTRTGNVVAESGDYTVSDITGAAPLSSPALTDTPTAPTNATATDNTDQIATDAFAQSAILAAAIAQPIIIPGNASGSAPSNTIGENNDLFLDFSNMSIWGPKASGAWPDASIGIFTFTPT